MKKKFFRLSAAGLLFFSGIMEIGWRFFNMVVCCKRGEHKKERKKWFELSHIRENHPRNGYARVYNESKAWCLEQKMDIAAAGLAHCHLWQNICMSISVMSCL